MTSLCAVLTAGPSPLSAMLYALAPPGTSSGQHIGLDGVSLGFVQEMGGRSSGLWTDPASGDAWANVERRCVEIALREFPKLSSRAVAELCGVDGKTVEAWRPVTCGTSAPERTGTDGKQYPARRSFPAPPARATGPP